MKRITLLSISFLCISPALAQDSDFPANFRAHLSGDQEVPMRDTGGTGQALFRLSRDGTEITYRLIVANIDNVVQSHIHAGVPGMNGPVVVFLFGPAAPAGGTYNGVLAEGTITSANLIGALAGQQLSVLIEMMRTGGTYVNVHTNDGVGDANTGPGDFPGGEIRGLISGL